MANKSIKDAFQRFWQHCVLSFATKEYVDNAVGSGGGNTGGGGGNNASGGGIIDVTELPTTNLDEKSIYRVPIEGGVEIWMVDDGNPIPWQKEMQAEGMTFNAEVVETLPGTLTPSDPENEKLYAYVLTSTGVAYVNVGGQTSALGFLFTQTDTFDKGWTTNINAETEDGIYCVSTTTYTYHACKNGVWTEFVDKSALNQSGGGGRVVLTINLADLIANGNVQIPDSDIERLKANFENSAIKMLSGTDIVVLNPAECYTDKMYYSSMSKTDQGYSLTVGWLKSDGISWGFAFINKPILDT